MTRLGKLDFMGPEMDVPIAGTPVSGAPEKFVEKLGR
jgi:hypothetical protein